MRLLIVDDDKAISNFLRKALKAEYYQVDVASDGEHGAFLACTNDYDLIILDNHMPKKDGKTVCTEIRAEGRTAPILMLSIDATTNTKADLLDLGADDYLAKPFSLTELLARVRALLRRPKQIQDDILTVNGLVLDSRRKLVTCGGEAVYLTVKEFALLDYLIRNRGTVLSRSMILEHVWDMNADAFSNTIEAHISNLRKKIERPGKPKIIKTVPGRGYKIES
ncbi:MAG: Transcriptional regulatory protein CusR [bacterium ADurb.Bin400]|nr:MAG: Transcriptional regulatory protein CusR [bacterium ADurb.Bin400]